jgi:hypothetical protein
VAGAEGNVGIVLTEVGGRKEPLTLQRAGESALLQESQVQRLPTVSVQNVVITVVL